MKRQRHISPNRSAQKLNSPPAGEPWVWLTKEMLESFALRALSNAARKVIDRIALEHMAHAGTQNGKLAVTYQDFRKYGIRGSSIYAALEEAIALGFIVRTDPGRKAWGEFKGQPARYRLGWLPDASGAAAINRWKTFASLAEARVAAERARMAVSSRPAPSEANISPEDASRAAA